MRKPDSSLLAILFCLLLGISASHGQDLDSLRDDQINRSRRYLQNAIQTTGLVRDSLVLDPSANSYHPATPDAAGFALLGLSALDHLDKLSNAELLTTRILNAYTGNTPGVHPERSANGHFIHFMDIADGSDPPGWDDSYTPIGTALLVAGAQFARNHFSDNATIASLTEELTNSVDFNAAIHPSLDGGIFLDVGKSGEGTGGAVRPWNEFMLVESLALREENNERALAVKDLWLEPENLPKISLEGIETLTDNPSQFASGFWVQQMHFFNGDFRHNLEFEQYFENHRDADKLYSSTVLGEEYRYGLTAGVSPQGYHADRIWNHPNDVFSPEAVAAWGDMEALLQFVANQNPSSDPHFRFGLVRESAAQPDWVPGDAGLVDHLFLLFGLVESIEPDFFAERMIPKFIEGDFNHNGEVDGEDFIRWQQMMGDTNSLAIWQSNYGNVSRQAADPLQGVPEPSTISAMLVALMLIKKQFRQFQSFPRAA